MDKHTMIRRNLHRQVQVAISSKISCWSIDLSSEINPANLRRRELGEFLRARRLALDPNGLGLITHPYRHKGLGREQVAELAGISGDWYGRLEGGLGRPLTRNPMGADSRPAVHCDRNEVRLRFAGFAEPRDEPSDALREEVLTYLLGDPLQVGLYVMDASISRRCDGMPLPTRYGSFLGPVHPPNGTSCADLDEPHVVSLLGSSYEGAVAGLVGIFRRSHTLQPTPFSHQILEIALQAPIVRRFWDEHVVAEQVWPASGPYPRWHPTVGVVWINSLSLSLARIRGEVLVALAPADPSSAKEFARLRAIGKALQSSPARRSLDPN